MSRRAIGLTLALALTATAAQAQTFGVTVRTQNGGAPVERIKVENGVAVGQVQFVNSFLQVNAIAAPAVSPAATGRIFFDTATNKFRASENGAAYVDLVGGGGGAPTGAQYITAALDATLTAERVLTAGSGMSVVFGVGTATVSTNLSASDGSAPNIGSNLVHWDILTGVPAGFADGTDDGTTYSAGTGLTLAGTVFSTNLAASDGTPPNVGSNLVHWDLLVGVPAGFADGTDDGAGGGVSSVETATGAVDFVPAGTAGLAIGGGGSTVTFTLNDAWVDTIGDAMTGPLSITSADTTQMTIENSSGAPTGPYLLINQTGSFGLLPAIRFDSLATGPNAAMISSWGTFSLGSNVGGYIGNIGAPYGTVNANSIDFNSGRVDVNEVVLKPGGAGFGTNGAMYYDSGTNKFRGFENGAWVDMIGGGGGGSNADTLDFLDSTDFVRATGGVAETVDGDKTLTGVLTIAPPTAFFTLFTGTGPEGDPMIQPSSDAWGVLGNGIDDITWSNALWKVFSYNYYTISAGERKKEIVKLDAAGLETYRDWLRKIDPIRFRYDVEFDTEAEARAAKVSRRTADGRTVEIPGHVRTAPRLGVLAETMPPEVSGVDKGHMVELGSYCGFLLALTKDQQNQIDDLRKEIDALKKLK